MAYRTHAMICTCTNCVSNGALQIKESLEDEIRQRSLQDEIQIIPTGASGLCVMGPILIVQPEGVFYRSLTTKDVPHLVEEHFLKGRPVESLMYVPPGGEIPIPSIREIPFFKSQRLIALRNRGLIDPDKIDEYIANDGYRALAKVLKSMSPEEVVKEIKESGLRGRGGAGFATGRKWESARKAPGDVKYVICNADEGDPGAFMDRSIIEADPHSVIEGMVIGGFAVGSSDGYVYIRIEYPLAIERLTTAINQAREYGLLGENIFDSGFDFDLTIFKGAGAFVCGESSSLRASIEGWLPEPVSKHVHATEKGLWEKPTVLNNVETWANIPPIVNRGAGWYSEIGTETSKGTKVFSLAGNINNAGLVEVPMGITLREIIYDIGGGIPGNKKFKAVQTGGPSGGCIPEEFLDLPVDYESLEETGSIMGSGGMIVMDENTCMVDVSRYFIDFLRDESCGKCTSCREGLQAMYDVLTNICEGHGKESDIGFLQELSEVIKTASLCQLGQTAPNLVLTTLRYFQDEYEAHIDGKKCPAGVCKELIQYRIDSETCKGCMLCNKQCPQDAIDGKPKEPQVINEQECIKCGICSESCKFDAVLVE